MKLGKALKIMSRVSLLLSSLSMLPWKTDAYCVYEQGIYRCYQNSYYGMELVLIPMFLFVIVFAVICLFALPEQTGPNQYVYYTPVKRQTENPTPM